MVGPMKKLKNPRTTKRIPAVATIVCRVSLGMFRDERAVRFELPGGHEVFVMVDRRNVVVPHDPLPGKEVDGRIRVAIVELRNDSALVDLPQASFTMGPRLEVPRTLLELGRFAA